MAQIIKSVVGHKDLIARFFSVITSKKIAACYLLAGPSGIGKKKVALAFAQEVLCLKGQPACGTCPNCIKTENMQHEEILIIEPEGTQIKTQQAEEIHKFLNLRKMGAHRFIIIDQAHLLNPQAGNSLLKILEEPPDHTTFFLITHSDQAVLKTLRSRSQIVQFSSIPFEDLKKQTQLPDWILHSSQGRFDLLEQLKDPDLDELRKNSFQYLKIALTSDLKTAIQDLKQLLSDKNKALNLVSLWQQILRDILFYKNDLTPQIHSDQTDVFKTFDAVSEQKIHALFEQLLQIEKDIYGNIDRTLTFENFILNLRQ